MPAWLRHRQRHRVTAELRQLMGPSDHFTVGKFTHCSCPHQRFCFVGMQDTMATKSAEGLPLAFGYFRNFGENRHFTIDLAMENSQNVFSAESLVAVPGSPPTGSHWSACRQCGDIWPSSGRHHAIIVTRATTISCVFTHNYPDTVAVPHTDYWSWKRNLAKFEVSQSRRRV